MSDIQPDPYIDSMAAEHVSEYTAETCRHCEGKKTVAVAGLPEDFECPACGGTGSIVPPPA